MKISPAKTGIAQKGQKGIAVNLIHCAKVDVIPDSGISDGCGKRIAGRLDLSADFVLHGKNNIIVFLFDLFIRRRFSETALIGPVKKVDQIRCGIFILSGINDLPYFGKIRRVI